MKKPLSKMTKQEAVDDAIMFAYNNLYADFLDFVCDETSLDIENLTFVVRCARAVFEVQPQDFREHCREHLRLRQHSSKMTMQ